MKYYNIECLWLYRDIYSFVNIDSNFFQNLYLFMCKLLFTHCYETIFSSFCDPASPSLDQRRKDTFKTNHQFFACLPSTLDPFLETLKKKRKVPIYTRNPRALLALLAFTRNWNFMNERRSGLRDIYIYLRPYRSQSSSAKLELHATSRIYIANLAEQCAPEIPCTSAVLHC